jgi:hypothetical protein
MSDRSARWTRSGRAVAGSPAVVAVATWLVFVAVAMAARRRAAGHALHIDVQVLPLAVGVVIALGVAIAVALRRVTPRVAGLFLGLLAGWVSFTLLVTLAGTPYGIGSVYGDCGRTVAAAQQFRLHWGSGDQFIKGNPSQYPPLWFLVWGRVAALLGRNAYQIQGVYQGIGLGAVVLLAGGCWRLVLSWPRAVAAAAVTSGLLLVSYGYDPCKGHEISAALLSAPALLFLHLTVLAVFAGGRRWWAAALAGAVTGVAFLLYQLFVVFSLPGLLVLWGVLAIRAKQVRMLAAHLGVAAGAAFVVTSWYLVPLVPRLLSNSYPRASDPLMVFYTVTSAPGVPVGLNTVIGVVVLAAVALLAWSPRRPLAAGIVAVIASAVLVQTLALFNIVRGGESFYSYRTVPWLVVVCAAAVVVLADPARLPAGVVERGRLHVVPLRRVLGAGLAVLLLFTVQSAWTRWHAPTVGVEAQAPTYLQQEAHNGSALAYLTPLPDCARTRGLPASSGTTFCFPAAAVQRCVVDVFGPDERPVLVSYDDRMAEFYGDHQYLGTNGGATNALDAWAERVKVLQQLATEADPATFLAAVRNTKFGRIDGFVLAAQRQGTWRWVAQIYHGKLGIDFTPGQFTDPAWRLCRVGPVVVALDTG